VRCQAPPRRYILGAESRKTRVYVGVGAAISAKANDIAVVSGGGSKADALALAVVVDLGHFGRFASPLLGLLYVNCSGIDILAAAEKDARPSTLSKRVPMVG